MNKFVIDSNSSEIKEVTKKINFNGFQKHNREQILFRIHCCLNCFKNKKCNNCNCNPLDKVTEPISCNKSVFPNILSLDKWENFKKEHNIEIL